jgi:hypothetical protein
MLQQPAVTAVPEVQEAALRDRTASAQPDHQQQAARPTTAPGEYTGPTEQK